ncbi:hypothetical protein RhiirB3_531762 [Rhizophagus irregularis]|nr:hypothetical protein RhiirB3_531762 [Rhizophagus irregularis]
MKAKRMDLCWSVKMNYSLANNISQKFLYKPKNVYHVTLLVKGNTLANAFSVKISRDEPVSELKKVIKAEKQNDFAGVDADKLRLWKVEIGGDHLDDPLKNLTLNDNNELSAINEIGDYWTEKLPKKHIHVLVEPPASTATSAREQELLERISLLEKSLSKSVHGMYFCQEISGTVQSRKSLGYESLKLTGLWKAFTNPVVALQHSTLL